jgi:PhnB protein
MSVQTTAHINFNGEARTVLEFYKSVFGGETAIATYSDIHAAENETHADQIAFGRLTAPNGFDLMAYDVQPSKKFERGENSFYITLEGNDAEEIKNLWEALSVEAKAILIPLAPALFAPLYGMLTDRFGITWIVGVIAVE